MPEEITEHKTKIGMDAFYGLMDQGVVSLTNFFLALFLIRYATKQCYGLYSIGYAVILLVIGVNNALITTQMTVNAPYKPPQEQDGYCMSLLLGQSMLFVPLLMVGVAVIALMKHFDILNQDLFLFAILVGSAGAAASYHDFFRRLFYLKLTPNMVVILDSLHGSTLFLLLYVNKLTTCINNWALAAVLSYAISASITGTFGLLIAKMPLEINFTMVRSVLKESWVNGKWALGGVLITHVQTQSYVYFLAGFAGTSKVAEANAARLLLSPLALISTGLTLVFLPRLAIMKSKNQYTSLTNTANRLLFILICSVVTYSILIFAFKGWFIDVFLKNDYGEIGSFIILWAVVFLLQVIRSNASMLLQVFFAFKKLTIANIPSAVIVILLSLVLIDGFGVAGGLISLAVGECVLAILLHGYYYGIRKDYYR